MKKKHAATSKARPESPQRARGPALILKGGREKSLLRRHPWVFSGAVERVEGTLQAGDAVRVESADGVALGVAAYSPQSQIRARMWTFAADTPIDISFLRARVAEAVARRNALFRDDENARRACRLVHGEADGLPGLIADRYGDVVVMQCLAAGIERWRETLADALAAETGCAAVYERSDADVRELEGLAPRVGPVRGDVAGGRVEIREHGLRYIVDVAAGQKTGFYLDQRENRAYVQRFSRDADVLNCFCYTGGFSLAALAGGARSVLSVDSSGSALELARANFALNGFEARRAEWAEADVFAFLRELRNAGRSFDLIVLDPPKFAPTAAHAERASRAYKDINLLGLKLLRPGGRLVTFSCSGGVNADLFQKIVAGAAADAGVDAQILDRLHAAPDHAVMLSFPEGEYLKGLAVERRA